MDGNLTKGDNMGATLVSSNKVTMDELSNIALPNKTHTYVPVSHVDFIRNTKDIANRVLDKHQLHKEQYGIAKDGKQMFGTLTYKEAFHDDPQEIGLSIGLRNSYDKSMSLGLCSGASVFVCENLMMTGEIVAMRMHTGSIIDELKGLIFNALLKAEDKFSTIHADSQQLKNHAIIDNTIPYNLMGRLYGYGVLTERQLPVMKREWNKSQHEEFKERNAWSLYNAGTEALKTTHPMYKMKRHIQMHRMVVGDFLLPRTMA